MENNHETRGTGCEVGATLARIDTNVRWIMKVGSVVGGILIMLGGVLFTRDWIQADAIASINTEVAILDNEIANHLKNGVRHEPARRGP